MDPMMDKIRLGISACLLGQNVRWNGGHALDRFLAHTLGKYVEYIPVCPEVGCGFGIPRDTFRLVGDPQRPRLVVTRSGADHTERMEDWARRRVAELEKERLCGFIFKSDSPSSGMERVKVYDDKGMPRKIGMGIFARIFRENFPLLPVEEDGRLHDPLLRENFIERIFTGWRFGAIRGEKNHAAPLVNFHTRNKLLLMAHSPKHLKEMGPLVAQAGILSPKDLVQNYERLLMEGMALKPTPAKHTNVLMHIMGYFKKDLSAGEKQELLEVIDDYRRGIIPLIVPVTLLLHYVRKYDQAYLRDQTYLNPHPAELMLRNHV
jgi:uncharacterized protein YbgA (DUF1722 family)/uncharacterized protein YbbK (DUF523 family)